MDRHRRLSMSHGGSTLVCLALAAVIATGIVLRVAYLDDVQSRSPDEMYYTEFAARVANEGLGATRGLFAEYEGDSAKWSYPVPNRIAYVLLVAAAMRLANRRDEICGVAVSCVFSILSLFLLAWIGLRFFNGWVAVGAVAFMAFSVGELGIAPRVWVDATFAFFGLLLLYTTCEITRNSRRVAWYLAFFAVGVLLMLTKQTGVFGFAVCGLYVMWVVVMRERYWRGAAFLAAGGVGSIALTLGIWGILAGSVGVALSALNHSLHPSAAGRAYIEEVSTGAWYRFFYLLLVVGPLTAVMALGGALAAVLSRRVFSTAAEARAAASALAMTASFVGVSSFVPGMQNLRYIGPADGAYCLLAGVGLWSVMSLAQRRLPRPRYRSLLIIAVAIVALDLLRDNETFRSVVLRSGMEDMPAKWILERIEQLRRG